MAVYKRGRVWWYRFTWKGEAIRESTKQTNKRVAEQMEAAHKTSLAKGEVGIRDRKVVPTLLQFAERDFLLHVRNQFAEKPTTLTYYQIQVGHLKGYGPFAAAPIDAVTLETISGFVAKRREAGYQVSSINRALQVLRRMLRLAVEWRHAEKAAPRVSLLPGERRRERVLSVTEEAAYLEEARNIGEGVLEAYRRALEGIRAMGRGQQPIKPQDPYLLRDVATVLLDCGLRPEECYRLRWEQVRAGALHILYGKTANARRSIPLSKHTEVVLEMRRLAPASEWVFPAPTKSGHIEQSTSESNTKGLVRPLSSIIFRSTRSGILALPSGRSTWTLTRWLTSRATAISALRAVTCTPTWNRVGRRWSALALLGVGTILGTLPNQPIQQIAKATPYSNETEKVVWYAREDSNL